MPKILGREPAAIVSTVEAALVLLLSFSLFGLTAERVSLIMAVVVGIGGVVTAYYTTHVYLGVLVGMVKAVVALAIGYGANLTEGQTAALIAITVAAVGLFQRTQTSPAAVPSFTEPAVAA